MITLLLFCSLIGTLSLVPSFVESTWLSREIENATCSVPGFKCQSCQNVSYCIELNGGLWLEEFMYTCEAGTTCLQSTGACTLLPNPSCDPDIEDYTFKCRQVGIFPDPLNCFEYHICKNYENSTEIDEVSDKMFCDHGFYFDPLTTLCKLIAVDGTCPAVVPPCTSPRQTGALELNPSLYYICLPSPVKSYPQIFACPYDKQYNGEACEEVPLPPPAAGEDGRCSAPGLFYDPEDCRNFYECVHSGSTPILNGCDDTMHFNTATSFCEHFKCSDLS